MAAVAMVTILNASRARRGSIRSLADEDIPGVNDDDGDEHFVTDAIPESCIIHKRDVSKTAPCADLLPRMSKRASYAQVQIASSGEPTMIEKICTIHQYRPVASDKLSRALRPAPDHACAQADPKPGFHRQEDLHCIHGPSRYPAGPDLGRGLATGPGANGARAVAPTPVRARHLRRMGPARRCERASLRGHLRTLLASDPYPPHQVVWAPRSGRAGTAWRGGAHSCAQMGEAFGMRRSEIIACYVNFLANDTDGSLAIEAEELKNALAVCPQRVATLVQPVATQHPPLQLRADRRGQTS